MTKKTSSKQRAINVQNAKRKHLPRIPVIIMSPDECSMFDRLNKFFPSKKATVIAGLKLLDDSTDSDDL